MNPGSEQHTDIKGPDTSANKLLELITRLAGELSRSGQHRPVTLDTSLDRELGFDSLTRVELLARIEREFHVSLPEQILSSAETPRDFLRALMGASGRIPEATLTQTESLQLDHVATLPEKTLTLVQALKWHVEKHPDRLHIRFYSDDGEGESITYAKLWQGAERIAAGLQHSGLSTGESVLIMLPTGAEYFFSFFGALLAGGVPVPLYPPGRIKQIEEHLRRHTAIAANCQARFMITMPEAKPFARLMHRNVETLGQVVTVDDIIADSDTSRFLLPALGTNQPAFLQYTSGSTGMPKGVVLTHANLLANIRAMGRAINISADDVFVSWLPLYHDMGLIGAWLGSLYFATPLIIMQPLSFIARPIRWLKAIHRFKGTLSAAPNFAYELCLRRIDDKDMEGLDLSSWRCAFNGAEAVSPATMESFVERFSRYGFRPQSMMPVYGLAESSVGLAFPPLARGPKIDRVLRRPLMNSGEAIPAGDNEDHVIRFVNCGHPLPGHQIRIVDDRGRELPERIEGRLEFLGPSSTSGYFRNPAATADLFDGDWLDSGDRAYFADGEIYITGRNKDIIIRAGRNIYPEELEEEIGKIDGVRQGNVAVFGSSDKASGTERLVVLAETRKRSVEDHESLRTAVNTLVNDLAGTPPDEVVLAPPNTVLKTSSGKIRRAASRQIYESGGIGKPQRAVWLQIARFTLTGVMPRLRKFYQGAKAILYAAYAWLLFMLAAPAVWILVAIVPSEALRWGIVRLAARLLFRLAAIKVQFSADENPLSMNRPFVMVSNHASYIDGIVLSSVLPGGLSYVAKGELRENFISRLFLKRLGSEFVERFEKQKGVEDARTLAEKGRRGRTLLFFAEGTFMRMPGLLPFRMGAFETAINSGISVVPVAIRGTRSVLRAGSWFPRRGIITVSVGRPIDTREILKETSDDHWKAAIILRDRVRDWILNHCGEPDLEHEKPPILSGGIHNEQ